MSDKEKIDVDSGMIWIGDPCYILPDEGIEFQGETIDAKPGLSYRELLRDLREEEEGPQQQLQQILASEDLIDIERCEEIQKVLSERPRPKDVRAIRHERGHKGKGMVIHPGSDGSYTVRMERDEQGWLKRVIIEIRPEEDDE